MLVGIMAAPFIKRNDIVMPPRMRLMDFEQATFTNLAEQQEKFLMELPTKFVIKGSDLMVVINRENYKRKG